MLGINRFEDSLGNRGNEPRDSLNGSEMNSGDSHNGSEMNQGIPLKEAN